MPRNAGIGRTGKKHKKKALFDTHRQPKVEADVAVTLIWAGRVRSWPVGDADEDRVQQVDGPQELWSRGACLLPSSLHENMLAGLE